MEVQDQSDSSFQFHGTWKEFAKIALPNLLLTIVTLGIYRFWATTRERQYLWGRTQFVDEYLEWTGTGKELFIGALLALVLLGIPFLILQFGVQAIAMSGSPGIAGIISLIAVAFLFYLIGVATFRGLRYRLSRTFWRGIRGGSNDNGFIYGTSYVWKSLVGTLAAGLMVPWAQMSLWNERWREMSFGPHQFQASGNYKPALKRYILAFISVIALLFFAGILFAASFQGAAMDGADAGGAIMAFVIILLVYPLIGLFFLAYYAVYFREAIGGLSLESVDFQFTARTKDWLKLILGHIGIVIVTLGIGYIFLSYRNWKFFISHLEATGEIDLNRLTQSETTTARQGEGLLDALDVGAI